MESLVGVYNENHMIMKRYNEQSNPLSQSTYPSVLKQLNYLALKIMEGEDITPVLRGKHNNGLCCRYWRQISEV